MNVDEAKIVLDMVSALDRKPVTDGAEIAWHLVLGDVDLGDAIEAVKRHYSAQQVRPALPGDIRAAAHNERNRRQSLEARKALEAAPVTCTPEVREKAMAEIRAITAKWANLDRPPVQRGADTTSPVISIADPDAYEAERARQLRLLESFADSAV